MQQEILVHHEKRLHHQIKQFVAGLVKLWKFPLPPKNEEVVQKLHPIGRPTDGITVAATDLRLSAPFRVLCPHSR